jgi:hypothetical protein
MLFTGVKLDLSPGHMLIQGITERREGEVMKFYDKRIGVRLLPDETILLFKVETHANFCSMGMMGGRGCRNFSVTDPYGRIL